MLEYGEIGVVEFSSLTIWRGACKGAGGRDKPDGTIKHKARST
jgi:hypothetical protein